MSESRTRLKAFVPLQSWRLQIIAIVAAVVAAVVSMQSFASAREGAGTYLIQPGDTLSTIAANQGVSVEKLVGLNNIGNPDLIIAGQTLALSTTNASNATNAAPAMAALPVNGSAKYTVRAGDTLWDIAHLTGAPIEALVTLNNLDNADQLTIGQVLTLPATANLANIANTSQRTAAAATPTPTAKPKATATPSPTAKPKPTLSPLQQKVQSIAQGVDPKVHLGIAATNLISGEKLAFKADETFPSASVMKLPILVELERQIAAGTLSWTESLRAEAGAMISVSDNNAANQIAEAIHPRSVNDTMASLGLGNTRFLNLFADTRSQTNPGQNQTTPSNMARLLELIATDQIVNSQTSGDIRSLLARNSDRSKLARLLPPDARIGHKSGWYDGVANDVGIVTVDRVPTRWTIAVLAEGLPDAETGNQLIATISKAVYDAWAP